MRTRAGRVRLFAALLVGGLLVTSAPSAEGLTLELSDGTTTATVSDGDGGDFCPELGCVTFIGTIGVFFINVSTGLSTASIGGADAALDLNSLDASANSGGTLTIKLTDTDFGQVLDSGVAIVEIGGTTQNFFGNDGGTITYTAYLDPNNVAFATTTLLGAALGPLSGSPFADSASGPVTTTGPFSLTQTLTLTHPAGFVVTSFDASVRLVPQPTTLTLIGAAMLAIVVVARRRAAKASRS